MNLIKDKFFSKSYFWNRQITLEDSSHHFDTVMQSHNSTIPNSKTMRNCSKFCKSILFQVLTYWRMEGGYIKSQVQKFMSLTSYGPYNRLAKSVLSHKYDIFCYPPDKSFIARKMAKMADVYLAG